MRVRGVVIWFCWGFFDVSSPNPVSMRVFARLRDVDSIHYPPPRPRRAVPRAGHRPAYLCQPAQRSRGLRQPAARSGHGRGGGGEGVYAFAQGPRL